MEVKLFSTNCPQCKGIERMLKSKGIEFELITDLDQVLATGKTSAPILQVDGGDYLVGKDIHVWINNFGK